MMNLLPVFAAFMVVSGMLSFLVYCGKAIDAEEKRVKSYRPEA